MDWNPQVTAPKDTIVLTFGDDGFCVAYRDPFERWRFPRKTYEDDVDPRGVTHWMPLPAEPAT